MRESINILGLKGLAVISVLSCACGSNYEKSTPRENERGSVASTPRSTSEQLPQIARCPVCGLEFNPEEAKATYRYGEQTYYFLLEDHQRAFRESPEIYVDTIQGPARGPDPKGTPASKPRN